MIRLIGCALALGAVAHAAWAQEPYPVFFVDGPLVVDGVREAFLEDGPSLTTVTPISHEPTPTRGWILATDTHLHVFMEAEDRDLRAERTERDSGVWRDDVMEVFLQPEPGGGHFNFEINPLGTIFDGHTGAPPPQFNPDVEIGITVHGTLNDPADRDEGWNLEVAIPFDAIGRPAPGDVWRFHLARYDWSIHAPDGEKQLSSTAPLTVVDFHRPEQWGELVFRRP